MHTHRAKGGTSTNNKVLVTGGAGFIGSTLVRSLLDKGYQVTVLDNLSPGLRDNLPVDRRLKLVTGDVSDFQKVSEIVRNNQNVIHLAAQAFIPFSYQQPLEVAHVNAIGHQHLQGLFKPFREATRSHK